MPLWQNQNSKFEITNISTMSVFKTAEEYDYEYVDIVPFYGEGYFIIKDASTVQMQRLHLEAFQVTPMCSDLTHCVKKFMQTRLSHRCTVLHLDLCNLHCPLNMCVTVLQNQLTL